MPSTSLLKLSRPRFWIYLIGPALLGLAAALTNGGRWSWIAGLTLLVFTFPANLFIYGVNDIFDQETDALNPKKQGYEARFDATKTKRILWVSLLGLVPSLVLFLFLPRPALISFLMFLFLGAFYSAPPIRAKAIPFVDAAFNILYLMPALAAWYAFGGGAVNWLYVVAGAAWCMAMHAYSAIPDIEADTKANLRTVATSLGKRRALLFCAILYAMAAGLLYWLLPGVIPLTLGALYLALMLRSLRTQKAEELFRIYAWFPWINAFVGFSLFWWVIIGSRQL